MEIFEISTYPIKIYNVFFNNFYKYIMTGYMLNDF